MTLFCGLQDKLFGYLQGGGINMRSTSKRVGNIAVSRRDCSLWLVGAWIRCESAAFFWCEASPSLINSCWNGTRLVMCEKNVGRILDAVKWIRCNFSVNRNKPSQNCKTLPNKTEFSYYTPARFFHFQFFFSSRAQTYLLRRHYELISLLFW